MTAPSTLVAAERMKTGRPHWLPLALFCLGHFFVDLYSGALGTMQPVLLDHFRLSYTQAGILGGALVFSSSVMQPVYGYLSDRLHSRLFAALGPAMAGIFISTLGWAPGYAGLLAMVVLGGAGIAAFHPQAAANAVAGVRRNRGRAMAVFVCSGSLGLAVGPLFFSALTRGGTLAHTPWGAAPGLAVGTAAGRRPGRRRRRRRGALHPGRGRGGPGHLPAAARRSHRRPPPGRGLAGRGGRRHRRRGPGQPGSRTTGP